MNALTQALQVVPFHATHRLDDDDKWTAYINAPEANPVLAIIERGRRLKTRKDALHTIKMVGFNDFCRDKLKMSSDNANKFIAIADWCENHRTLCGDSSYLPPSLSTLYALSRLPADVFDAAIAVGQITPEMTRKDAEALKPRKLKAPADAEAEIEAEVEPDEPQDAEPDEPSDDHPAPWEGPSTIAPPATTPTTASPTPTPSGGTVMATGPGMRKPPTPLPDLPYQEAVFPAETTAVTLGLIANLVTSYAETPDEKMIESLTLFLRQRETQRANLEKLHKLLGKLLSEY